MRLLIALTTSMLIWVLIFSVLSAFAQPVKINTIGVVSTQEVTGQSGPVSMPLQLQRKVARVSIKRVAARGINIVEGRFIAVQDPFPGFRFGSDVNVIFSEFSAWANRAAQMQLLKKREVLHVLAPPLVVNNIKYMGGAALVCSAPKGGYSYSNAMDINSRGANRVIHSIHGFMHEILHAIGANHIDATGNVMHPDALQQIESQISQGGKRQLTILNESRSQVHRCIGK